MIEKIKKKWEIESNWQIILILAVFSLTGSSIIWVRKFMFTLLDVNETSPLWLKILLWTILLFPVYHLGLLFFGFLLGQFDFFWKKEKKIFQFIVRIFRKG